LRTTARPPRSRGTILPVPAAVAACLLACSHAASAPTAPVAKPRAETAAPVEPLAAKRLAVGRDHVCQLLDDGTVRCAGWNGSGQLGEPPVEWRAEPTPVPELGKVASMRVLRAGTCAFLVDGRTRCWGFGRGDLVTLPLEGVVTVAPTQHAIVFQTREGAFYRLSDRALHKAPLELELTRKIPGARMEDASAGSANAYTREGDWVPVDRSAAEIAQEAALARRKPPPGVVIKKPVLKGARRVPDPRERAVRKALIGRASWVGSGWALDADGTLRSLSGKLLEGVELQLPPVPDIPPLRSYRIGGGNMCFVTRQGEAACRGDNTKGQLGHVTPEAVSLEYGQVMGLTDVVDVAPADEHTCALTGAGDVWCWGDNHAGQLGDGTRDSRMVPRKVRGLSNVRAIAAAGAHTCAIDRADTLSCWGSGSVGQLGLVLRGDREGVRVVPGVRDAVAISGGTSHTCARTRSGTLSCWGSASYHEDCSLNDAGEWKCWYGSAGNTGFHVGVLDAPPPTTIPLDDLVTQIALGADHTCATTLQEHHCRSPRRPALELPKTELPGELFVGRDSLCHLVDGVARCASLSSLLESSTPDDRRRAFSPIPVQAPVLELGLGHAHACARTAEGVSCWGTGPGSLLGVGLDELPPVVGLAVGSFHACALDTSGSVWCWGLDPSRGTRGAERVLRGRPTKVAPLSDVVEIGAADATTCARKRDRSVHCWGSLGGASPTAQLPAE
jgi:alpha-tubulin suppressor-like RCC1 family protein